MIIYMLGKVFLFSTFFKIFSVFGFLQFEYDMPRCGVFFFFPFDIYIAWCSLNFLDVPALINFRKIPAIITSNTPSVSSLFLCFV